MAHTEGGRGRGGNPLPRKVILSISYVLREDIWPFSHSISAKVIASVWKLWKGLRKSCEATVHEQSCPWTASVLRHKQGRAPNLQQPPRGYGADAEIPATCTQNMLLEI